MNRRGPRASSPAPAGCAALLALALAGCSRPLAPGALVLTQSPVSPPSGSAAKCNLDTRYPPGSRVVLIEPPFNSDRLRVLSAGLSAAGSPLVSYDGQQIFFIGKPAAADNWQIYEARLNGGAPRRRTSMPGGASHPALLPDGSLVFVSPTVEPDTSSRAQNSSALYRQSRAGQPRQLTFTTTAADDPTVLADGRILFTAAQPRAGSGQETGLTLYTINNDGTEISAFSGHHGRQAVFERPRQLPDGRIVFVRPGDFLGPGGLAQTITLAQPFRSPAPLITNEPCQIVSVEPASNGALWVCARKASSADGPAPVFALFRVEAMTRSAGAALYSDPAWETIEAAEVSPSRRPMGRLSSLEPKRKTGRILCLDANFTSQASDHFTGPAVRARVLKAAKGGQVCTLGEVPVQTDGSFLAEVPADVALGFETLDARGSVLHRVDPVMWVRPGENRSCIGCHEPHNQSPRNVRPLALCAPAVVLTGRGDTLAKQP